MMCFCFGKYSNIELLEEEEEEEEDPTKQSWENNGHVVNTTAATTVILRSEYILHKLYPPFDWAIIT